MPHSLPSLAANEWALTTPVSTVAELEQLCADRPPPQTEIFAPNGYYGVADILKRWAGTPRDKPLMIALPHGVEFTNAKFFHHRELVPVFASYCRDASLPLRQVPLSRLWYIASPYTHVIAMTNRQRPAARRGSLFFSQHSTVVTSAEHDVDEIISRLHSLPSTYHPIAVCVYWADVQRGLHRRYRDAGFRVVSAGHTYDPLFLYRFHRLCLCHRYALHSDFGSAVIFSIKSGCRALPVEQKANWQHNPATTVRFSALQHDQLLAPELTMFRRLPSMSRRDQSAWADHLLGTSLLRPPRETAALIRRAERLDRWGFLADPRRSGRRNPLTVPPAYRRRLRSAVPAGVRGFLRRSVAPLRGDYHAAFDLEDRVKNAAE